MIAEKSHMKTEFKVVPKLRFGEFNEQWSNYLLDDIAVFLKGKGISKSELDDDGITECIRYGELYVHYNELIDEVKSKTNLENVVLSKPNDVIIPASGETQLGIATASCVLRGGIALGGDLNIIRTENNGLFLSYYLNNNKKFEIARLSQGISVVHLYSSQLKTLRLNLPSLPEQQKIASFLSAVDEKLQQLNKKKDLLETYKKGVMQKIFSQELRFKDDNGNNYPNWEEKKLGELCDITTGKSNREDSSLDGEYTFFDRSEDIRTSSIYLFDGEAVIIAGEGSSFPPKYFKGKFDLHQRTYAIMGFENLFGRYLFYYLHQYKNYFVRYAVGSTVKSLRLPIFKNMNIHLPSLDEQQKIATFLSALDDKIELVSTQIENTKDFKKGLLQQMFV